MESFKKKMFLYCVCVFFTGVNLNAFLHHLAGDADVGYAIATVMLTIPAYLAQKLFRQLLAVMAVSSPNGRSFSTGSVLEFSLSVLMCGYLAGAYKARADGVAEGTLLWPALLLVVAYFNCRHLYVRMLRPLKGH